MLTVAVTNLVLCSVVVRNGSVKIFGFGATKDEEALEELT